MYNDYPITVPALYAQTYKNFEIILVHDGPIAGTQDEKELAGYRYDPRLKVFETEKPGNDWGHAARAFGLTQVSQASNLIVFGSADNYYMPEFFEYLSKPFDDEKVQATYCNCLHNVRRWEKMECAIQCGLIDCGNFMTRTKNAIENGWTGRHYEADWKFVNEIQQKFCNNAGSVHKIDRILFIHN
jgi:glycosyltransferase involved in cell wall biosynthesis